MPDSRIYRETGLRQAYRPSKAKRIVCPWCYPTEVTRIVVECASSLGVWLTFAVSVLLLVKDSIR